MTTIGFFKFLHPNMSASYDPKNDNTSAASSTTVAPATTIAPTTETPTTA